MKMNVYFLFEGIVGRETFETSQTGLDAFRDAFDKFADYARAVGAVRIEGPRSAWDHVPIYHGPIALGAEIAK